MSDTISYFVGLVVGLLIGLIIGLTLIPGMTARYHCEQITGHTDFRYDRDRIVCQVVTVQDAEGQQ